MSFIKTVIKRRAKDKQPSIEFREVENYRDDNGKHHQRVLRYLGKELPKDLPYPVGFRKAKLVVGKRIQISFVGIGMEDFFNQVGTIRGIMKRKAKVDFDLPIRGRKDWTVPLDMLGNITRD